jgi:hypothetical protein
LGPLGVRSGANQRIEPQRNAIQPNPTQTKPNQTKPNHPPPAQIGEQDEREGIPERPVVLFNQRLSRWGAEPGPTGRAGVWRPWALGGG